MMVATNPGTFRAMLRCQQELQRTLNRLSLQAEDSPDRRNRLVEQKNRGGGAETTVQDIRLYI